MHPATYYVKFLVLKGWPDQETLDTVNQTLQAFDLPDVTEEGFETIKSTVSDALVGADSFVPNNRNHEGTKKLMESEKVFEMWRPTEEDVKVFDLIGLPGVKETVQMLLMGRFDSSFIADKVSRKYKMDLSEKTVHLFKHYFWNVELAGISEWAELLYKDRLRDSYLASLSCGKVQALFRAGFSPVVDGKKALKEAHRSVAMRIEATRMLPDGKDTSRILSTLSASLVSLNDAIYGDGAGMEDMMKELRRFIMERDAPNVVSIHKLAPAGNYSGSGVKQGDEK